METSSSPLCDASNVKKQQPLPSAGSSMVPFVPAVKASLDLKQTSPSPEKDGFRSPTTAQQSQENNTNSSSLLAGLEEFLESSASPAEVFLLNYRGSSEVDRHYTKPMLPWIIAEIKNQKKFEKVKVEISQGLVNIRSLATECLILTHSVKQIHKCVMEQADHTHFLYTLKPPVVDKENVPMFGQADQQQLPANTTASTDHHCYLFKADSENDVRNFFKCLRQQPRDYQQQMFRANSQMSCHSLPDLFLHNDSQFYEVLFVGRVKVSHAKVPASFIDEACEAFKLKSRTRKSSTSEEVPSNISSYQKDGSGDSVPNITLSAEGVFSDRSRSNSREFNKENVKVEGTTEERGHKKLPISPLVLASSSPSMSSLPTRMQQMQQTQHQMQQTQQKMQQFRQQQQLHQPRQSSSPTHGILHNAAIGQQSVSLSTSPDQTPHHTVTFDKKTVTENCKLVLARRSSDQASGGFRSTSPTAASTEFSTSRVMDSTIDLNSESTPTLFTSLSLSSNLGRSDSEEAEEGLDEEGLAGKRSDSESSEPFRQRLRTISGSSSPTKLKRTYMPEHPIRARAGSIGSSMGVRSRVMRQMSEAELKSAGGCEWNRTMLLHIGREELQLINPELKSVQLHKNFKDVPQRCQGTINNDHFGFICREVSGDIPVYVGYVFRCDNVDVTNEIVHSLNKSFEAVQSAYQREKQENSMCESCPMRWFSSLCSEVEGLAAHRAHTVILKRVQQLPEADRELLLAKYEGADAPQLHNKNNVLMMLLRAHLEAQQATHVHPQPSTKGVESSLDRVKKSLATSFHQLLKRDSSSAERDTPPAAVAATVASSSTSASRHTEESESHGGGGSPVASPAKVLLENVSESPLGKTSATMMLPPISRPRSNTVSTAGGDTMRREFRAKMMINKAGKKDTTPPPNAGAAGGEARGSVGLSAGVLSLLKTANKTEQNNQTSERQKGSNDSISDGTALGAVHSGSGSLRSSADELSTKKADLFIQEPVESSDASSKADAASEGQSDSLLEKTNGEAESDGAKIVVVIDNSAIEADCGPVKCIAPMTREVEDEVYSGVKSMSMSGNRHGEKDGREDRAPRQTSMTSAKMEIFLKIGPPGARPTVPSATNNEEHDSCLKPPPSPSFRHAILQRVITPTKPDGSNADATHDAATASPSAAKTSATRAAGQLQSSGKRGWPQLRLIWRKAVFRQMLLIRIERETRFRRAEEEELEVQRVCLSYSEESIGEEALQTWQLVLSRPHARIDPCIVRAGVRHGVTKSLRGEIWQLVMNQHRSSSRSLHAQASTPPEYNTPYEHMIKGLTSQQHAILIDLGRTFPKHPYFTRTLGPGQLGLFNLLKAYSLLDEEVGYCQGLSFVAGILLMHVNEETAYQLLKHLMFVSGVRRQFRQDLDGLQVQMYQLSRLLHDQLRPVYLHLEANDISPQLYAAPWFLTLFASSFPLHFVVRLYDLLFMEGLEAVFRIGLVLLTEHQDQILACNGFEDTMCYLKTRLPDIPIDRISDLFGMAFDISLTEQLSAYEVEYQVLREELSVASPYHQADINKLQEEKKLLKRQNIDLVEQLQNTQAHKHALEASNQMLLQSQHHLEVRVRFLEVERNNLKQVLELMCRASAEYNVDLTSSLPPGLLRYLPSHSSSPKPLDRRDLAARTNPAGATATASNRREETTSQYVSRSNTMPRQLDGDSSSDRHVDAANLLGLNVSGGGGDVGGKSTGGGGGDKLSVASARPARGVNPYSSTTGAGGTGAATLAAGAAAASSSYRKSPSPDSGFFGIKAGQTNAASNNTAGNASKPKTESDSLFPPFNFPSLHFSRDSSDSSRGNNSKPHRARSTTMDHGSVQRFVRGLTRNN